MQLAKRFEVVEIYVLFAVTTFQAFLKKPYIPNHLKEVHILISLIPMSGTESNQTIAFN